VCRAHRLIGVSGKASMSDLFLRCLKPVDERVTIRLLLVVWGPAFEFVVRLLLVATFLDDSFRAATHFSEHITQVGEQGYLKPLAATSPELVGAIAMVALGIGLLAQSLGSLCLLANFQPDHATKALVCWAIVQPVLYAQLANGEFVAESLSLIGGLFILRAQISEQAMRDGRRVPVGGGGLCAPDDAPEAAIARAQLVGRLLLPAIYLYHALVIARDNLSGAVDHTEYTFPMLATEYAVNAAVLVVLVLGCTLVAVGLRSRTIALSLAVVNLVVVCCMHPFFRFVWIEGGRWKYNEDAMRASMPHVSMNADDSPSDLLPWHILDLHRYYFFQGLSTSGALLLLAMFGPGEIAVEEDVMLQKSRRAHVVEASSSGRRRRGGGLLERGVMECPRCSARGCVRVRGGLVAVRRAGGDGEDTLPCATRAACR